MYGIYREGNDLSIIGAVFLVIALVQWFAGKEVFTIILHTSAGEKEALTDEDIDFVERVQRALNDAVVFRG